MNFFSHKLKNSALKAHAKLFVVSACILTSCLNAKKLDKHVSKQYEDKVQTQKRKQNDFVSVTSPLIQPNTKISTSETTTSNLLPLLVYWSLDYKNTCTLNPQIPINNFTSTVFSLANKDLKQKLNGQKLELSVEQVPNKFTILDKGHLIFLIYAYGWDNVSIKAENMDMVISYRILKDDAETKKGMITMPYGNDKQNLGMFKSWKKATTEYLDQYDANITSMSKQVVAKLINEL